VWAEADLMGRSQGGIPPSPTNLAHNKFEERPSGASTMQENFSAAAGGAYSVPPHRVD